MFGQATEEQWDETVALYKAMNKAYAELPKGVFASEATAVASEAYESALRRYSIMDSEIVDECWWDED